MKPIVKVPLKFGVIAAIMLVIVGCINIFSGRTPMDVSVYLDIAIFTIFLFLGIKEFKDYHNQNLLEFAHGMTVGFIIYASIAIISSIFILIVLEIDQTILDTYIADRLEILDEKKSDMIEQMGEATYETAKAEVTNVTSLDLALDNLLKKSAIGLTLTIMISVIMRRKPKESKD